MLRRARALGILAVLFPLHIPAQNGAFRHTQYAERTPNVGDLLVASEKLGDPNFIESVVLIIQLDEDKGVVGIIINRRSEIPLSKVFPQIKGASSDPAFLGGPVQLTGVQALLRQKQDREETLHITSDIYVTSSRQIIEDSVRSHDAPSKFRLYAGYAGWGPGQLDSELRLGAWKIVGGHPRAVFDDDPESLWSRLSHESHMQVARLLPLFRLFG